jgi:hypothetical protein
MLKNFGKLNCFKLFSLILIIAAAGAALCAVGALICFLVIGILIVPLIVIAAVLMIVGMIVQAVFIKIIIGLLCFPRYYWCCSTPADYEKPGQSPETPCYGGEQPPEAPCYNGGQPCYGGGQSAEAPCYGGGQPQYYDYGSEQTTEYYDYGNGQPAENHCSRCEQQAQYPQGE